MRIATPRRVQVVISSCIYQSIGYNIDKNKDGTTNTHPAYRHRGALVNMAIDCPIDMEMV